MPRLSRVQQQVRRRVADLAAGEFLPEQLGRQLLEALNDAIPADGWVLYGLDPVTLLFNRVLAERAEALDARSLIVDYLTQAYLVCEPENLSPPGLMRASVPVVVSRDQLDACWGLPQQLVDPVTAHRWTEFYREEIGAAPGGTLSAYFQSRGAWVAALDGLRLDQDRPFQPTDAWFVRLLNPTIGAALRASLARERVATAEVSKSAGASGVIILTADDRILLCSPAAEAWIALLRDTWRPETPGKPQLPVAIWSAVAQHRACSGTTVHEITVVTPAGALRIEAAPGGADGSVVVVLSSDRSAGAIRLPDTWELTPAEQAVVYKVADGLTNREIANALFIGEHTVERHLHHIYEKLGLRSRGQLLARLFQDASLPTFRFASG